MDATVPSKRPHLSIEVKRKASWNQDEWTEFLTDECRIKRDKANQIASKLAEQDFQTGKFSSFVEEWKVNANGCVKILMRVGFQEMDIVSFIAALRRHIEKEKATSEKQICNTTIVTKRRLCNELVWAVCKGIGVVKTSDRILLTSANIYAYLEKAFRKKAFLQLIYRDLIRFLKANDWCPIAISIKQLGQNIKDEMVVVSQRVQLQQPDRWRPSNEYKLRTNHLHIHVYQRNLIELAGYFSIDEKGFENAHVHFFVRLIAPQFRPIVLDLTSFEDNALSSPACFLNKMQDCIDWVELDAEQFPLEPINAVLSKCNKLKIRIWNSMMDEDQMRQFCDAFIQWINARNGGQPKMCAINYKDHETVLRLLLDAVNKDFSGAAHKQPFAMRIEHYGEPLAEFTMRNARTGVQLHLKNRGNFSILIRQSITELDAYDYKQLECEFKNVDEMASIDRTEDSVFDRAELN